jgi:hypothetical protein
MKYVAFRPHWQGFTWVRGKAAGPRCVPAARGQPVLVYARGEKHDWTGTRVYGRFSPRHERNRSADGPQHKGAAHNPDPTQENTGKLRS